MALPTQADIVVIGAGIVGSSLVRHLAGLGWRDILLIDKGPLPDPGGSTGHASNFIFPVDHSQEMTALTLDSMRQYADLGVLTGCGAIEVSRTEERDQELHRRMSSARAWGVETELIGPDRIQELVPWIRADLLRCGFFTPSGGVVDPVRAGELLRTRAAELGGLRVAAEVEVLGIDTMPGGGRPRVSGVRTDQGAVATETVVVACGVWSPAVAALAGARIPLTPTVHQMMDLGPIPELAATGVEISFPVVRDMDERMYERQRGADLEVGSYAHRAILHRPAEIPPLGSGPQTSPTRMPFTHPDFGDQLTAARRLFPSLLDRPGVTEQDAINGLLSLTPDGAPLLGETPEVAGLWSAAAVWIKEGPGVGRAVAELLTHGASEVDVHGADIARFYPVQRSESHVRARAAEGFPRIYGIAHPREQWGSHRGVRVSPFHSREVTLGAEFFEVGGWERPQWYAANEPLLDEYADQVTRRAHEWDARWWSPIIEAEHLAMRERVAMIDLTPFAVFDVTGTEALSYLQRLAVAQVDRPVGRVIYTPLLDPHGGFRADLTILRLGVRHFRVVTGGADGARDLAWFTAQLPADGVALADLTSAVCTIGLWGPRARDLVSGLTDADLTASGFEFGAVRDVELAGIPTQMVRISYVGDLGWEIHLPTELGGALWDALREAGAPHRLIVAGAGVYGTTGRLEKAHRLMGAELTSDYDPVEAGLALPRVKDADFVGKASYLQARGRDPAATLCTLALAPGVERCPTGHEPILDPAGGPILDARGRRSFVTSAGPAPSLRRYLLLGYLPPAYAVLGTHLQIDYLGERLPAEVLTVGRTAPFDPEMSRPKG
ncbi:GcvT family protein [Nocardioides insulae]|uniref:GcvT family protein n=1 Tax=Nocardioides insulae TaxID=394734 RepID=UPI00040EEF09|nr:FAD-dependent oxidoreductase [Nocardioides insulae]